MKVYSVCSRNVGSSTGARAIWEVGYHTSGVWTAVRSDFSTYEGATAWAQRLNSAEVDASASCESTLTHRVVQRLEKVIERLCKNLEP
jgi:hypothetical protein